MKIGGKKEENTKESTKDNIENKNLQKGKIKLTKMEKLWSLEYLVKVEVSKFQLAYKSSNDNNVIILSWIFGCAKVTKKK